MRSPIFAICTCIMLLTPQLAFAAPGVAKNNSSAETDPTRFSWTEVEEGFLLGRYRLSGGTEVIASEVLLLKFSLEQFSLHAAEAKSLGKEQTDIKELTSKLQGIAGINANFFDVDGKPLGLIVSDQKLHRKVHRGGKLLTGVFYIQDGKPHIRHRSEFSAADEAIQSGPRLIESAKAVPLSTRDASNRRSGIAITRNGEIIIFATFLRFPGATFSQIQEMLLDPRLEVTDALNLDGGGSSQLFVKKNIALVDDTFITGGQDVPVGIIVRKKTK